MYSKIFSLIMLITLVACTKNTTDSPTSLSLIHTNKEQNLSSSEKRQPVSSDNIVVSGLPLTQIFQRVIAVNPHLTVISTNKGFSFQNILKQAEKLPGAIAGQPFIFFKLPVKDRPEITVALKGVDPARWLHVMEFNRYITQGETNLHWDKTKEDIPPAIIGQKLANKLNLVLGSELSLRGHNDHSFRVIGIFDMQYEEYDFGLVITDINAARTMINYPSDHAFGIELRLKNAADARNVAKMFQTRIGMPYKSLGWCELNAIIFRELCSPKLPLTGIREQAEKSCDQRNGQACVQLGQMWGQGHDGQVDQSKAHSYYEKSCALENPNGCEKLGSSWRYGYEGSVQYVKARSFLKKACDLGSMQACLNLGYLFQTTKGGPQHLAQANELFAQSCIGGNGEACTHYSEHLLRISKFEEARTFFLKACEQDIDIACDQLSQMWAIGLGGPLSEKKSQQLYTKAIRLYNAHCETNNDSACEMLRTKN